MMRFATGIWLYLVLITIVIGYASRNTNAQDDLVKVRLKPQKFDQKDSLSITCEISNTSQDTVLILSSPFFIDGETSASSELRPWPGFYFVANVLFYEQSRSRSSFTGDTDIRPFFSHFPTLLVLKPREKIDIKLLLPSLHLTILKNGEFQLWSTITYGVKRKLDELIKPHHNLWESFQQALITTTVYSVSISDSSLASLAKLKKPDKNLEISRIMWEGMQSKATSPKVVLKKK